MTGRAVALDLSQREAGAPPTDWRELMERRQLPALDGLRAVAVFMVIFGHLGIGGVPADVGVAVFFVLSGFLITWLLLAEREETGGTSLRKFYARRALRIFPAYFAYLAFTITLDTVLGDLRWKRLLPWALTYTLNYYNALHGHPSTSVAHLWSLAVEEQFYLLWPALFVLVAPRGRRAVVWALAGSIAVVLALRCWLWYGVGTGTAYVYNAFEMRFDNLAVGCLLAVVASSPAFDRWARSVSRQAWWPLGTAALVVGSRRISEAYHYGPGLTADAVLIALLLVQILMLHRTALWRWLDAPLVRFLGRISYPLYLYHGWGNALGAKLVTEHGLGQVTLQMACCIALATGSYYLVERPFLRLKRRFATA